MRGRYTLATDPATLRHHFGVEFPAEARYNVAPTQQVPVIRDGLAMLRWGLVPGWLAEPKVSFSNINARREAVATSPAFRSALKSRRCLMPADGFYEWAPEPPKVPHHFRLADGEPCAFAGLWERWEKEAEPLETCALVTTDASPTVAVAHVRIPVIHRPADYARWLDASMPPADLLGLLVPYGGSMTATLVGPYVSSPAHQGPRCVEPA